MVKRERESAIIIHTFDDDLASVAWSVEKLSIYLSIWEQTVANSRYTRLPFLSGDNQAIYTLQRLKIRICSSLI